MKTYTIIYRYIFLEFIPPFVVSLVFFIFIFLMTKILEITNYIVNYRIGFGKIILLIAFYMPYFLTFIIPMSVMMSVLLTFLRLSTDNEILALKSSGVSLYALLPPVVVFCTVGCLFTGVMTTYGSPWSQKGVGQLVYDMASTNFTIGIKERLFNNSFEGVMLYVNKIDTKNNILNDIFVEDQRNSKIVSSIIAPKGTLQSDPKNLTAYLQLSDGIINQVDLNKKTVNIVNFETYTLSLPIKSEAGQIKKDKQKDEKKMSLRELWEAIAGDKTNITQHYKYRIELQNKFSIPFACFTLGLLAVPLGVQSKARRQSYGLGLGLFFFLLFYLLLSMGWVVGKTGYYPPEIGIWVPNLVMGALAVVFMAITVKEGPINLFSVFLTYIKGKTFKNPGKAI